jgi:hypothetical protein
MGSTKAATNLVKHKVSLKKLRRPSATRSAVFWLILGTLMARSGSYYWESLKAAECLR